jgi:hypothetical protein
MLIGFSFQGNVFGGECNRFARRHQKSAVAFIQEDLPGSIEAVGTIRHRADPDHSVGRSVDHRIRHVQYTGRYY